MGLVHDNISLNLNEPQPGVGLVAEGGGQRGVFTAGVLDSFLAAKFNPFQVLVGTSAGAQNVASYTSGQIGYAYCLINDLTRQKPFFSPWRMLTQRSVMDLDWYFEQTKAPTYHFDEERAERRAQNRIVRFSTTHAKQFYTELVNPSKQGWLQALKLSSAIPYLYKSDEFVDGGVTAPIPVAEANELGANNILVIRTSKSVESSLTKGIKQLKPLLCPKGKCPGFLNIIEQHETAYANAETFIQAPPKDVKVTEIVPSRPLQTKVLGSTQEQILADYKLGLSVGHRFLKNLN